jgi:hypothetical protein
MKKLVVVGLGIILSSAARADAQSPDAALFVDGAVFASIERRAHSSSSDGLDADLSGTVAGGGAALGTWLTPRLSVRLELAVPARLDAETTTDGIIVPVLYGPAAVFTQQIERSERIRTLSALLAYHTARHGGVQMGYLAGAAFIARELHQVYTSVTPLTTFTSLSGTAAPTLVIVPLPRTTDVTLNDYAVNGEVGLDADVAVGIRFSVVPQVRVTGVAGGLSVRPGVAARLRW